MGAAELAETICGEPTNYRFGTRPGFVYDTQMPMAWDLSKPEGRDGLQADLQFHAPILLTACLPTASKEAVMGTAATSSQEDETVVVSARNVYANTILKHTRDQQESGKLFLLELPNDDFSLS